MLQADRADQGYARSLLQLRSCKKAGQVGSHTGEVNDVLHRQICCATSADRPYSLYKRWTSELPILVSFKVLSVIKNFSVWNLNCFLSIYLGLTLHYRR